MQNDVERLWTERTADRRGESSANLVSLTTDREIERLRASVEEMGGALDKANKRINRLLGEKTQLKAMLEKRDEQMQWLNRELGGYLSAQKRSPQRDNYALRLVALSAGRFGQIIEGIKSILLRRARSTLVKAAGHIDDEGKSSGRAALVPNHEGPVKPMIAVLLFGLGQEEIRRLLPIIERDCVSRAMRPLCLIDTDAFELLRTRGLIFEYLPPADDRERFDASLHWDLYVQRRLAVIRRKWDPVRIVSFGVAASEVLALWSLSPFEETPLPAVVEERRAS